MIDHHPYRLAFAKEHYGVVPINFAETKDPAQWTIEQTRRRGVDATIDAVGFEAKGSSTETLLATLKVEGGSGAVLRQCIAATRCGGVISIPGVYAGYLHAFMMDDAFDKGLTFKMGQTHVQRLLPKLLDHIEDGDLPPEGIISHRLPLAEAARGYQIFNDKEDDCRTVVLTP
jgi:threonine dehydrogenase-like Zn-dependent dehydrogenase